MKTTTSPSTEREEAGRWHANWLHCRDGPVVVLLLSSIVLCPFSNPLFGFRNDVEWEQQGRGIEEEGSSKVRTPSKRATPLGHSGPGKSRIPEKRGKNLTLVGLTATYGVRV